MKQPENTAPIPRRQYSFISLQKRKEIIHAATSKEESIKACALRLGVKYITAKQIVKRWKEKGQLLTKGCKKESQEEEYERLQKEQMKAMPAQYSQVQQMGQYFPQNMAPAPMMAPVMISPPIMNQPVMNNGVSEPLNYGTYPQFSGMEAFNPAQMGNFGLPQQMGTQYAYVPVVYPGYVFLQPQETLNQTSMCLNSENSCLPKASGEEKEKKVPQKGLN